MRTPSRPKNVLVVDSQCADSRLLAWQLPRDRYNLTVARNYGEAIQLADQRNYDLALIEVDLPRRNSMDLLKEIRSRHPDIKVIMFTDYGDDELWVDVMNQGATDLLSSQFKCADLERQFT